jgi:rhodanese-related sulfurtransferase
MNLISREQLKEKLDRGDDFKLVMVLGDWAYRAKHIPGSLNISRIQDAANILSVDDEASQAAYRLLVDRGFENVRRYAGGLSDWEDAGYPLEGEMVTEE